MPFEEITHLPTIAEATRNLCECLTEGAVARHAAVEGLSPALAAVWLQPKWGFWSHWCSTRLNTDKSWPVTARRYFISVVAFGVAPNEEEGGRLRVTGTMTHLAKEFRRKRETVFLRGEDGRIFWGHRGYLKEPVRGKKLARDAYMGANTLWGEGEFARTGPFGDARHPVIVIGALDDPELLARTARFVHEWDYHVHGGETPETRLAALQQDQGWRGRLAGLWKR